MFSAGRSADDGMVEGRNEKRTLVRVVVIPVFCKGNSNERTGGVALFMKEGKRKLCLTYLSLVDTQDQNVKTV